MLSLHSFAQQARVDSLRSYLKEIKTPKERINLLYTLSETYLFINPDSSIFFAKQVKELAQQISSPILKARGIYRIGLGQWIKGNLAKAFQEFTESLEIATNEKNELLMGNNIQSIGLVCLEMDNSSMALNYYQKSVEIFQKIKDKRNISISFMNIGNIYIQLSQMDSAQYYLQKASESSKKYAEDFHAYVLLNYAEINLNHKKYTKALEYILKAEKLAEKYTDKQDLASAYRLRAKIHQLKQQNKEAGIWIRKSLEIAKESKMKESLYKAYQIYSDVLEDQDSLAKALQYHKLFITYKDSLKSNVVKNALQIFQHEKKQKEISQLQTQQAQQTFIIYSITIVLTLLSIITLLIVLNRSKIYKINQDLRNAYNDVHVKKEEILSQNEELKQYQEEMKNINNHLEDLVNKRTLSLQKKNQLLTDYAFFNAHKLRSPVATILGLYQLLDLNPSTEEVLDIFEKIKLSICHLDHMVRKSQEMLNENDDDDDDDDDDRSKLNHTS